MREAERTTAAGSFHAQYAPAFRMYLDCGDESGLRAAYELGRDAVAREVSLLQLASAHHDVLLAELGSVSSADEARRITRAAAHFLLEMLSASEMVRRGLTETLEMVALERRQAAMLRHLSTLLADASLAIHAHSSLEEVLQLVSEHARELTGAVWCVALADPRPDRWPATSACSGTDSAAVAGLGRDALAAVAHEGDATAVATVETSSTSLEVIAAPFRALDGSPIGAIAVAGRRDRRFSELDKAVLVHIAQMTAAGLERAMRYRS